MTKLNTFCNDARVREDFDKRQLEKRHGDVYK